MITEQTEEESGRPIVFPPYVVEDIRAVREYVYEKLTPYQCNIIRFYIATSTLNERLLIKWHFVLHTRTELDFMLKAWIRNASTPFSVEFKVGMNRI